MIIKVSYEPTREYGTPFLYFVHVGPGVAEHEARGTRHEAREGSEREKNQPL